MPIKLVTGTPGAGKTLFVVKQLIEHIGSDDRPIFHNINGLDLRQLAKFGVNPFKIHFVGNDGPFRWPDYPDGAIFIFDEIQAQYPPRNPSKAVPDYMAAFETHRHRGFDFWMITQHPSLLDNHVKRLADHHFHLYRPFGLSRSTLFEWQGVNSDPNPRQSRSNAAVRGFSFPSKYFLAYKSASLHTVKRRIPWKLLGIVALLLSSSAGIAFLGVKTFGSMMADRSAIATDFTSDPSETSSEASIVCYALIARIDAGVTIRTAGGLDFVIAEAIQSEYDVMTRNGRPYLCRVDESGVASDGT